MTERQQERLKKERERAHRRQLRLQRLLFAGTLLCLAAAGLFLWAPWKKPDQTSGIPEAKEPVRGSESESRSVDSSPSDALPDGWLQIRLSEQACSEGTLVLVNRDYPFDPSLPRTVSVYENKTESYLVKDMILSVREDAMTALNRWMDDFAAETGKTDVNIVAGWRSYQDQVQLYENAVATKGQAHADAYLALPGHSEHHTGLAADLDTYDVQNGTSGGFDGDGAYAWAVEHAWEYGFIQRYPPQKSNITGINYESWHFRYVGLPHAWIMKTENLCLEEYVAELRNHPFSGEHLYTACQGKSYELYYCPKDRVIVPADGNYFISGNNVDGYIITICGSE